MNISRNFINENCLQYWGPKTYSTFCLSQYPAVHDWFNLILITAVRFGVIGVRPLMPNYQNYKSGWYGFWLFPALTLVPTIFLNFLGERKTGFPTRGSKSYKSLNGLDYLCSKFVDRGSVSTNSLRNTEGQLCISLPRTEFKKKGASAVCWGGALK